MLLYGALHCGGPLVNIYEIEKGMMLYVQAREAE